MQAGCNHNVSGHIPDRHSGRIGGEFTRWSSEIVDDAALKRIRAQCMHIDVLARIGLLFNLHKHLRILRRVGDNSSHITSQHSKDAVYALVGLIYLEVGAWAARNLSDHLLTRTQVGMPSSPGWKAYFRPGSSAPDSGRCKISEENKPSRSSRTTRLNDPRRKTQGRTSGDTKWMDPAREESPSRAGAYTLSKDESQR